MSSSSIPLVTAIVSTYKSERFMRGCLEDLYAQTICDRMEVIVIDSGSPENEGSIVHDFRRQHSNIHYFRTERETVYQSWNRAIRAARGIYVTNANTDDRHFPHAFETLVRSLESHPTAAVAYADCDVTVVPGHPATSAPIVATLAWPDYDAHRLFQANFIGPQPMWRRDLHERYGFFDETFVTAGDYEFWLRLAKKEYFLHVAGRLGVYLMSPDSIEHRNRYADRDEAAIARRRHWPPTWGEIPRPGGMFLRWRWAELARLALRGEFAALSNIRRSLFSKP